MTKWHAIIVMSSRALRLPLLGTVSKRNVAPRRFRTLISRATLLCYCQFTCSYPTSQPKYSLSVIAIGPYVCLRGQRFECLQGKWTDAV
ncbi:uncharacterized protein BP01DRAFT_32763 [Aspergillus saccharolyticus JOP 1030-1]|uniref:Secreted protein n=1 Tax=Aspergillus saccharolyticus JOP 1030-1 TaxID=1450539 RepID=A0A318ZPW4_9EURO|nr:hypothetical protein BP01DRAFT_32763 [Aspergillus saccharolyticus JOP 1030-1]PYH45970.1 hypothetical protein BP01DRAFT_32763 [Aspergillus saccharolyticus JOP 1030-1]